MAAVTRGSTGRPPKVRFHAIRTPLKSRPRGRANVLPGSAILMGTRWSGPANTLKNSATSCTVRAIGPWTESGDHAIWAGYTGTRPGAVRKPTTLQKLAG